MRLRTTLAVASLLVVAVVSTACSNPSPSPTPATANSPAGATPSVAIAGQEDTYMQIRLSTGAGEVTARVYDNATARDFASLLPLTLDVHDLGGREKAGTLPRELAAGQGQSGYRAGQLGYWAPSHDLAVYYLEDGFRVPSPGIVMIGEIETGLDAITAESAGATLTITAA
ncbi:cyclophilin-like fold protein [Nocardia araoensis]|uniref:cyclophilin-like fold protein n=1 Tax=Nocardia araoensis TaxID=228600 RepID=UPI00031F9920|nr:cyclophilin-like fold protein [Nocardia araoensis]